MKPGSGQASARIEQNQRKAKQAKGKRALPTMTYLKNVRTFQPLSGFPAWTGDEATAIKVVAKPLFDDSQGTQILNQKYPQTQRLMQVFPAEAKFEDPDAQLAFKNPEADPRFSSALFLCLSKGLQFFESGTFQIFPSEINPCGRYCVRMFENGLPVRLIFDDKIGCDENGQVALLKHTDEYIMLPTLLHKAYLRFSHNEQYSAPEIVSLFTGFIYFEVPVEWQNVLFWFGRPDSLVALYIKDERNADLGSDRLFHILDIVEVDQHRKFVKMQCPGARWRGRFSGFEEDTKHWTNQIRVLLEIDPETVATAGYFWMILDDVVENFDSIMVFSPQTAFPCNIRRQDVWVPREQQFYTPPAPILMRAKGTGQVQIYCAPLPTTAPTNELHFNLGRFTWNSGQCPSALAIDCTRWTCKPLDITKNEEIFELTTSSRGGYVMQVFSKDVAIDFIDYSEVTSVTASEGDLPFFIALEEFQFGVFSHRFELVGKVSFNLDQPGNVSFALFVTNNHHKDAIACMLFNCDTNDIIPSDSLRSSSVAITPNKKGYVLLIFGLYGDSIAGLQPVDLIGKWRVRIFSDVPLSDIVDSTHINYSDVEGDIIELDEGHQIQRHVLSGGCDTVLVLETSLPLSLTVTVTEDDKPINVVRGVGFCVLPSCKLPGDRDPTRLIVRSVCSEEQSNFSWKLRIYSTGNVTCKEDTAPAEKTAAAIAAWEKKRTPKTVKKSDAKKNQEQQVALAPAVVDEKVLKIVEGEGNVLSEAQIEELLPAQSEVAAPVDGGDNQPAELGDDLKELVSQLSSKVTEDWESYESLRVQISKLYTPPPKEE
jgi:hypothetical protein